MSTFQLNNGLKNDHKQLVNLIIIFSKYIKNQALKPFCSFFLNLLISLNYFLQTLISLDIIEYLNYILPSIINRKLTIHGFIPLEIQTIIQVS